MKNDRDPRHRRRWLFAFVPIGVIAVFLWQRDPQPAPPTPPVADALNVAPAEPAAPAAPAAPSAAAPRIAVPTPAATTPPDTTPLDILVVDAATGAPVEGAELVWNVGPIPPQSPPLSARELARLQFDAGMRAERFGRRARTNADGVARVDVGRVYPNIFARADGRFGVLDVHPNLDAPPARHRLELHADRELQVQVVDADGNPAFEIPVAIRALTSDGRELRANAYGHAIETERPNGIARLRHLQRMRPVAASASELPLVHRAYVAIPGLTDAGVVFDPAAPPREPIVLRLPPTGVLAARMVYGGRAIGRSPLLSLHDVDPSDAPSNAMPWQHRVPDDDGWTRFPAVPLGKRWFVRGRITTWMTEAVDGPIAKGQEVRVELSPPSSHFVMTGRLVDASGSALPETIADIEYVLQNAHRRQVGAGSGAPVETDADGRFVVAVECTDGSDSVELASATFRLLRDGAPPLSHAVTPQRLARGGVELGDVRLVPPPLVLAGRFVGPDGAPTKAVNFWVQRRTQVGVGRRPDSYEIERQAMEHRVTDGSTFELFGTAPPGRYRLFFPGLDHLPVEPIPFELGARDVVIRVEHGGEVVTTLLVPPGLAGPSGRQHGLRATLVPDDPTIARETDDPDDRSHERFAVAHALTNAPRQPLAFRGLPAGRYRLELRLSGLATPIASVDAIVIPPPVGGDPRLHEIDLRDAFGVASVVVRTTAAAASTTIRQPRLLFLPPDGDGEPCAIGNNAHVRLLVPARPVDVQVAVAGLQPAIARRVRPGADVVVELAPWPRVELTFPGLPVLPPDTELHVALVVPGSPLGAFAGYRADVTDAIAKPVHVVDGRARVPTGRTPREVQLFLYKPQREPRRVDHSGPLVAPTDTNVEVAVSPDALRGALAKFDPPTKEDK